jgi:hypothetical protein
LAATSDRDQQNPQLSRRIVLVDAKHTTNSMSIDFREPRPLARRVMISSEVGDDASDECFEFPVPAEFGRVLLAVCHHDPTKITGSIRLPDDDGMLSRLEHLLAPHRY